MTDTIDNAQDVIDSRDVIARIENLEALIESEAISEDNGATVQADDNGQPKVDTTTCEECGLSWNDALISGVTPAPAGRCPYEQIHDDIAELKALRALADEASGSPDWQHGATIIRDSYFTDYIEEMIADCYEMPKEMDSGNWPWRHFKMDYEAAADEAKADYIEVDFDGVTYYIRA